MNGQAFQSMLAEGVVFRGSENVRVRDLSGFQKGRHTVPRDASAAALEFVRKIAEADLGERMESVFEQARASIGFRRRDYVMETAAGVARLEIPSFSFETMIELALDDPASAVWHKTLSVGARPLSEASWRAIDGMFPADFQLLELPLNGSLPSVEEMIDAVEADDEGALAIDYPSTCAHCELQIEGASACLRYDGLSLAVRTRSASSPLALISEAATLQEQLARIGILREALS